MNGALYIKGNFGLAGTYTGKTPCEDEGRDLVEDCQQTTGNCERSRIEETTWSRTVKKKLFLLFKLLSL